MKKACKYCGKIHEKNFRCEKRIVYKPQKKYIRDSVADNFRGLSEWKKMREFVKMRDRYMCVACFHKLTGTLVQYNTVGLSVHHIIPLNVDFDARLDAGNLITLCQVHHEMAEKGQISAELLRSFAENNNKFV